MRAKVFLLIFLLFPFVSFAQNTSSRTGFVDGTVWFPEESVVLDETTKIYTAVFNGEDSTLTVNVDFLDENTFLGTKEVSIGPNKTETISIDWKVSAGSHAVFALISSAKINNKKVVLERVKTISVKFSVTKDIPGSVVKKAIDKKLSGVVEGVVGGVKGLSMEKVDSWFKENFKNSEEFREKNLEKIKNLKVKVTNSRETEKDASKALKAMNFLYFWFLSLVGFILSVTIVFYSLAVVVLYFVLGLVWRLLKKIFRRKYEE